MNQSFDAAGVQFAWDSTSIKLAETCLRKYQYKMILGWQPERKSVHLLFGGWYASALESYHKYVADGMSQDEALAEVVSEALTETWVFLDCPECNGAASVACPTCDGDGKLSNGGEPWVSDHNTKTRENLIRTIVWYVDQFGEDDSCSTVILSNGKPAVEHSFRLEADNDIILSGHLDRLVSYGGQPYIQDQKTTQSTISSRYFDGYNPDTQMCQPTGTLIQTSAGFVPIEDLQEGDRVISYHNDSPNLREQPITGKGERDYSGYLMYIAAGGTSHRVTPNHRVMMRYDTSFRDKHALYLMRKGNNFRIGIVQVACTRDTGMNGVSQRCRSEKADAIWILDLFNSRKEAWLAEQLVSYRYGVPQVTFKSGNFKKPEGLEEDQFVLDQFWEHLGSNVDKAKKVLSIFGKLLEYPIYTTEDGGAFASDRTQMVRACNIFSGVTRVPVVRGDEVVWLRAEIAHEPYKGKVYSLEVNKVGRSNFDGCYIANDIITGNSLYTFAGKAIFNLPIKGIMIDAAQIAVGFTRFERGFTFRDDGQLNEWYDNSMYHIEKARQATRDNYFPLNPSSCSQYGGCEFRHICSKAPSIREQFLKGDFVRKKTWDPLAVR